MNPFLLRFLPHALALAGLLAGLWYVHHRGYEAGYAKAAAKWEAANTEAAGRFAEALQDQQTLLIATDAALTSERRATRTIKESLDEALDTPAGDAWGDTAIPADLLMPLRAAGHPPVSGDPD